MNTDNEARRIWRCPKCRRWLPHRGAMHVCRPAVPLAAHFKGRGPKVRELYRAIRAALKKIGPVRMDSTKTRIAFRVWTNFLELAPMKEGWRGCLMLSRRERHPSFTQIVSISPRIHYHFLKLADAKQLDARFRRLLAQAYKLGRREHLRARTSAAQKEEFAAVVRRGSPQAVRRSPPARPRLRPLGSGGQAARRPLWRCPKCANYFVTRNLWHSCVRVPLEEHFRGKHPMVRKTFDALVRALRRAGPIRMVSSKTRITFMVRMRFAGVTPQKDSLPGGFGLMRPAKHPLLRPGVRYGRIYGYRFRLTHPRQIDHRLRRLLAEAYRVGNQEHLGRR